MSKPVTAGRRAAFLRALGETGSLTLSAERARVGKDWSAWTRKRDPVFDAACLAAIAAAGVALAGERDARGMVPPSGWGSLDGVQLVARGAPGRRVQVRRARVDGWSPAVETRFLGVLAATCNVKAACAEIRMTQASAYYHRRQWTGFGRAWDAALADGYMRLEFALIQNARNVFAGEDAPIDNPMPPITVADALHLLRVHQKRVHGVGKRCGPRQHEPDIEVVRAAILRSVEAYERADGMDAGVTRRQAKEWARR